MSWMPAKEAVCPESVEEDSVDTVIVPRPRDLGDFEVRRALPAPKKRMIGPFTFIDQMGPTVLEPGHGIDVRPHPHIGLATVTWLIEGELMHRDSLGNAQVIRPGELNWMTAGSGIVHSERSPDDQRDGGAPLYGIQSWVALPKEHEEIAPSFTHHGAGELPKLEGDGARVTVIAGSAFGKTSPVALLHETVYADIHLADGAVFPVDTDIEERGLFILSGAILIEGTPHEAGTLLSLRPGRKVTVRASGPTHLQLFGGAPMDGPRYIWWNFVSSGRERIEAAKADWKAGRFPKVPGDEEEFIPLPEK
jgi:redox-sensitive bicupin YhaK (pirin superfamily)